MCRRGKSCLPKFFILLQCYWCALADDNNHIYNLGEPVALWVNTIGPYHNPQETYPYYQLPFCKPDLGIETRKRPSGIGEILEGHELRNSGFKLHFASDVNHEDVCEMVLTEEQSKAFENAVENQYWYELYVDDLPMWGMLGETLRDEISGEMKMHIFTHRSLSLCYHGNQIIEVNLTSENPVPLSPGTTLRFTYSVHWYATNKLFESRFNRYLEYDFFEHQIHWFSIFNSFMMVVFLCGLVALILLRTLRNDFARYAKNDDLDLEGSSVIGEDSGWKQVHGDVFRAPNSLILFCALWGTGWQLVILTVTVILYALAGPMHGYIYEDRGEMMTALIVSFGLSSMVAGFASGSYYKQFFTSPRAEQKSQWQRAMIATCLLYPTVLAFIVSILNSVAMYYDTTSAIPAVVVMAVIAMWIFVAFPLSIIGTIFGRHYVKNVETPCRVNSIPRPIPEVPWYSSPFFIVPISGILPFGSIFIEMYFVFTAFWSYKFYYVYGFMLLVYGILVLVTICTAIVSTYFILNSENYHWQWLSFISSGSTAAYVFVYSCYYFFFKTQMTGMLQTSFYFGYTALFCISLFLMCGAIGSWGAGIFVRKIYRNVKID